MPDWMSDPLTWSVPAGRFFGIRVRIHFIFVLLIVAQLLNSLKDGREELAITAGLMLVLFFSVLFHEFGHCFAARAVGGEAEEILMWPLGGLAFVSVPHTARAEFISTVWGPLVNVFICAATGATIVARGYMPPLNPFAPPPGMELAAADVPTWLYWVGITFGVNWILFLFNMIPAFPMDSGRMLRCSLWGRVGFPRATQYAVQVAKLCAIGLGIVGFVMLAGKDLDKTQGILLIGVAIFVYQMSERERRMLEAGMLFDESIFGYDFSQGYTSLDKGQPKPKARRPSAWERWRRKRERRRQERRLAAQQEEERRVDEILAKLHREGMASLTEQEKRFLTRASEKYRSRNRAD